MFVLYITALQTLPNLRGLKQHCTITHGFVGQKFGQSLAEQFFYSDSQQLWSLDAIHWWMSYSGQFTHRSGPLGQTVGSVTCWSEHSRMALSGQLVVFPGGSGLPEYSKRQSCAQKLAQIQRIHRAHLYFKGKVNHLLIGRVSKNLYQYLICYPMI